MRICETFLASSLVLLLAGAARADTIHVPGDAATIQGAIALATGHGDTILVAPGTYVETIDDLGKPVVIESTDGAAVTIIDAAGGGSVVTINTTVASGTVLRGFTITGGTGTLAQSSLTEGGGVFVNSHARATLSECVITGNTVAGSGGGVMLHDLTSAVTLSDCTLSGNSASSGGAIGTYAGSSDFHMSGCNIAGNSSGSGAVDLNNAVGTIDSCAFVDNSGFGLAYRSYGLTTTDCVFAGNSGWGLTHYGDIGTHITGCSFLGNGQGGARMAAPKFANGWHSAMHCVFANGDAMDGTGWVGWIDLYNCTFDDTHVVLHSTPFAEITVRNTIFRGTGELIVGDYGSLDVDYSDIEGGSGGPHGIDADPLWVDAASGDYRLLPASPCIDTGDPARPDDPDGTLADMGAIPFENAFDDLGGGVDGSAGPVVLTAHSTLVGGEGVYFKLAATPPLQPVVLILGATALGAPFKGGTLWPQPSALINLLTNGAGQLTLGTTWPAAVPSGFTFWMQFWHPDAAVFKGYAASNGVRGTVP